MRKLLSNALSTLLLASCLLLLTGTTCQAQTYYTNPDTGYQVIIEDDAELLTEEEQDTLAEIMYETTTYGHALFKTITENYTDTETYARNYYMEQVDTQSGTLFLIDMDNRTLWIHSDGEIYRTITNSYADTITDNVYTYASGANYFTCAEKVFTQINTLLEGNRIPQPMKYTSNLLLALILALLINFVFVSTQASLRKPKAKEILNKADLHFQLSKPVATYSHTTETYSPVSSGSSSGGRSSSSRSSGSRSSGGGRRSGGGGGHRF